MTERFDIRFKEGGVDALETIITGGLAKVAEKGLDAITGDNDHGWYCIIKDRITNIEVACWGATKGEAQEKAHVEILEKIEDYENNLEKERAYGEKQKYEQQQNERRHEHTPTSGDNFLIKIIGWIIGVVVIVFIVIWLAVNIVLPLALLNSALILTIIAATNKRKRMLFSILAFIGGTYMIFDVLNGWFSYNFIHNVVKNPFWIHAFVYINAASLGVSAWFILKPLWIEKNNNRIGSSNRKFVFWGVPVLAIVISVSLAPLIFHLSPNPFIKKSVKRPKTVNVQAKSGGSSQNTTIIKPNSANNQNETNDLSPNQSLSATDRASSEKEVIPTVVPENNISNILLNEFTGTVAGKRLSLFIEKIENDHLEGLIIVGDDKKAVTGRIASQREEISEFGQTNLICKLILEEPNSLKGSGEYTLYLWLSKDHVYGKGRWRSYDGKNENDVIITAME